MAGLSRPHHLRRMRRFPGQGAAHKGHRSPRLAPYRARSVALRPRDMPAIALAVGLGAAAIASSVFLRLHWHEFYYTQLWIVPQPDAPDSFVVGLHSAEAGEESYAVDLLVDRHLVQSWRDVSLKPGQSWTTTFRWVGFGTTPAQSGP